MAIVRHEPETFQPDPRDDADFSRDWSLDEAPELPPSLWHEPEAEDAAWWAAVSGWLESRRQDERGAR